MTRSFGSTRIKRERDDTVVGHPWRHLEAVEFATLEWVDWFNHRRLLEPPGYVPPAEFEARYYDQAAVA